MEPRRNTQLPCIGIAKKTLINDVAVEPNDASTPRRNTKLQYGDLSRTTPPGISTHIGTSSEHQEKLSSVREKPGSKRPSLLKEADNVVAKRPRLMTISTSSPWTDYKQLFGYVQGGPLIAACEKRDQGKIVAIRTYRTNDHIKLERLRIANHANIVQLLTAYTNDQLYFVYEPMPTTIAHIQSCPLGPLRERELASIAQNVCHGINYILDELDCDVRDIAPNKLAVSDLGVVKIDVASILIDDARQGRSSSLLAVIHLVIGLMEPGTVMLNPNTTTLRDPRIWESLILDFLVACQSYTMEELVKHPFLLTAPESSVLVPYVEAAKRCKWHHADA